MIEPADFCCRLLATIDVADGTRRRRKRDTTPDAIGLELKRALLEKAVLERPTREDFERWLWSRASFSADGRSAADGIAYRGAVTAMAASILSEWRLCGESVEFREWLMAGAPSADASVRESDARTLEVRDHS
ncbi:MAG: type III secretion fhipep protein [Gemmatimonadota bacterium]